MAVLSQLNLRDRIGKMPRGLKLFVVAALTIGIGFSLVDSTFNNFINERFMISASQRSFLEFPRELPGVLVVFVSALLWFLSSRRLGGVGMVLSVVGTLLLGHFAPVYGVMVIWLFIYSLGQHLWLPVSSGVGMELAREGQTGRRLGQLNAVRNLSAIMGSFLVFLGFRYLNFSFEVNFTLSAIMLAVGASLLFAMRPNPTHKRGKYLELHGEYKLYYALSVMSGMRKQLFITFAPWVLVTIFKQPTQLLATLLTISGVIGILFQPFLGRLIDRMGERFVLAGEAVLLVGVCTGYGLAPSLLPMQMAFYAICACYLFDQMLFSVGMARSTFMKKIALEEAHVQPALAMSVTIDHVFSIAAALFGGWLWDRFGFQYVFLMGAGIAVVNFFLALQVRVPKKEVIAELVTE